MTLDSGEIPQKMTPAIPNKLHPIVIPPGKFESPLPDGNNFHRVITNELVINGQRRRVELLHQIRPGDCILANFLNTYSIEEACNFGIDSKLPMTVQEVRESAIRLRQQAGESYQDIVSPNSPLDYKDVVRLFSSIHKIPPKQEDILTVEARNKSLIELQLNAIKILDYLDTYPSGLCTTGLGYHSRTIKKLQGDNYALIDPMNPNGLRFVKTDQLIVFLTDYMRGRPKDENFFFFIRK